MAKRYKSMPMHEPSERGMEARAGGMISEDRSAIANMPQNVVYKEYPAYGVYLNQNLDDTMAGIQKQQSGDVGKANSQKPNSMY